MEWVKANLDKILAAATALLALVDWQVLHNLDWAVALLAILTFAAEWLKPKVTGSPPVESPQARK